MRKIKEVKPRLKEILVARGIKQNELAKLTGISESVLSRFDKQERHDTMTKFILRDVLGLKSTDELFKVIYEDKSE